MKISDLEKEVVGTGGRFGYSDEMAIIAKMVTTSCQVTDCADHNLIFVHVGDDGPLSSSAWKALASLPAVECLRLPIQEFQKFKPVQERFTKLHTLTIAGDGETEFDFSLIGSSKLRSLAIYSIPVDFVEIAKLTRIRHLKLGFVDRFENITALGTCKNLESLLVGGEDPQEWGVVKSLNRLTVLELPPTQSVCSTTFNGLTRLESLSVSLDESSTFDPVGKLVRLRRLNLYGGADRDLSKLHRLTELTSLVGRDMETGFACLKNFGQLERLGLNRSRISDLSNIGSDWLLSLNLIDCEQVVDLNPLARFSRLQKLCLRGTNVSVVSALASLKNLEDLDLGFTKVSDISPLANHPELESLNLVDTEVRDLSPLVSCPKLKSLRLPADPTDDSLEKLKSKLGIRLNG